MSIWHDICNLWVSGIITLIEQFVNIIIYVINIASLVIIDNRHLPVKIYKFKILVVCARVAVNIDFFPTCLTIYLILIFHARCIKRFDCFKGIAKEKAFILFV